MMQHVVVSYKFDRNYSHKLSLIVECVSWPIKVIPLADIHVMLVCIPYVVYVVMCGGGYIVPLCACMGKGIVPCGGHQ